MKKWLSLGLILQLLVMNVAVAQQEDDLIKNTQNDMFLVLAAGGGGALLGLSTLSFYETPSQHIRNIWTGAAIGIIAGVIFVAYNSAQRGSEELTSQISPKDFSTGERHRWHQEKISASNQEVPPVLLASEIFHFSF